MNIVRLIGGFLLFCVAASAVADDVLCTVASPAEETAFASQGGVNPPLAAGAGNQLTADGIAASVRFRRAHDEITSGMSAKHNASSASPAKNNSFASAFSGKSLNDIVEAAEPNWEAIVRKYATVGSSLSGATVAANVRIRDGSGWSAGGGMHVVPGEDGEVTPDAPRIPGYVASTLGRGFGHTAGVMDPAPGMNDDLIGARGSGGSTLAAGEGHGDGLPRPRAGPNAVTTASDEQGNVLGLQKGHPLTPPQKDLLNSLISSPESLSCTQQVFEDATGTMNVVDAEFGGNPDGPIEAREWQKYLANPSNYTGAPGRQQAFANAVAAMKLLLQKCFKPASQLPAYTKLNIPQRLGFISVDGRQSCEGLLISRDHILTARHCWFDSPNNEPVPGYAKGAAYFVPSGSTGKRYQVCAAETLSKGTSTSLNSLGEEQVVMRIAPVNYDPSKLEVFNPTDIKAFPSEEAPPPNTPVTKALTFTWVNGASNFDSAYKGDLAVGTVPCFVVAYDSAAQCAVNMCMTYEGTSGGPVFTQDSSGTWKLLGIHLGAAAPEDNVYPSCAATKASTQENSVLMPDMSLLAKFSTKVN